jgi:hypothetical protein
VGRTSHNTSKVKRSSSATLTRSLYEAAWSNLALHAQRRPAQPGARTDAKHLLRCGHG